MIHPNSQILFEEWKQKIWEFCILKEKSYDINKNVPIINESCFIDAILYLVFCVGQSTKLSPDQLDQYAIFIKFLMRSTLLFDLSFALPPKDNHSKLALMQGDFYLVRGGIEFSLLDQFHLCMDLLDNTLESISKNYQITSDHKKLPKKIYQNAMKRYGSIYYCALSGPYLLKGIHFQQKSFRRFSEILGLWIALSCHPIISFEKNIKKEFCNNIEKKVSEFLSKNIKMFNMLNFTHLKLCIQKKGDVW